MEYLNFDTLGTAIDARISVNEKMGETFYFPEEIIQKFAIQALIGLEYIHTQNIIHRDVKSTNIFINVPGVQSVDKRYLDEALLNAEFKIGDFNIAQWSQSGTEDFTAGTPFFSSPEML